MEPYLCCHAKIHCHFLLFTIELKFLSAMIRFLYCTHDWLNESSKQNECIILHLAFFTTWILGYVLGFFFLNNRLQHLIFFFLSVLFLLFSFFYVVFVCLFVFSSGSLKFVLTRFFPLIVFVLSVTHFESWEYMRSLQLWLVTCTVCVHTSRCTQHCNLQSVDSFKKWPCH